MVGKELVKITLKDGESFVKEVIHGADGTTISKRSKSMVGELRDGKDGYLHLHIKGGGYYLIKPENILENIEVQRGAKQ